VSRELTRNEWGISVDLEGVLELRWLPSTETMSDGGFMATLCLLAHLLSQVRFAAGCSHHRRAIVSPD
jgi:hypothetical protein